MNVYDWARRWGIPEAAIEELIAMVMPHRGARSGGNESGAQNAVRLDAARQGVILWRNNVGAIATEDGRFIRYGLANDSKRLNERFKSSDLIGIRPGGQFVAREVKRPGWRYTGTIREGAQRRFLMTVTLLGGDARFTTGRF